MTDATTAAADRQDRRKGRPPGTRMGVEKYTVSLDPARVEWAKAQPGGLSGMLRRLLDEEYARAQGAAATGAPSGA